MNLTSISSPLYMGQLCRVGLVDGTQIKGDMVHCEDGIVALDNVTALGAIRNGELAGPRCLLPLALISWIKPEQR